MSLITYITVCDNITKEWLRFVQIIVNKTWKQVIGEATSFNSSVHRCTRSMSHEGTLKLKDEGLFENLTVYVSVCIILCAGVKRGPIGQALKN